MKTLKNIIREQLEDRICKLIYKLLNSNYVFTNKRHVEFIKIKSDKSGSYDLPYPIRNKTEYLDLYYSMEDLVKYKFDIKGEDARYCIKNYIDEKINEKHIILFSDDEEYLEEAEEGGESGGESSGGESAGGGGSKGGGSSTGKEWESGLTRGPANPITYDSEWSGQRGWEGIKSLTTKRGKANPIE